MNSMGSSTVTTWSRSLLDDVVDDGGDGGGLAVAGGARDDHQARAVPRRRSATTGGRLRPAMSGTANGMVRITAPQLPRCLKMEARKRRDPGQRVAAVHLAEVERREARAGRLQDEVGDGLGVVVGEGRVLGGEQLPEHAVGGWVAHLEVDVARLPLHRQVKEGVEHLLAEGAAGLRFHGGEVYTIARLLRGPSHGSRSPRRSPGRRATFDRPRRGADDAPPRGA